MALNINSTIPNGKHRGKKVRDVLSDNRKDIFSLIKSGLSFDDEVLSLAGIKKNIRDVKVVQVFTDHVKDTRKYEKDTESLSRILKEIRTLDNINESAEAPEQQQNGNTDNQYDEEFEFDI